VVPIEVVARYIVLIRKSADQAGQSLQYPYVSKRPFARRKGEV
jgi:hypothetical protein